MAPAVGFPITAKIQYENERIKLFDHRRLFPQNKPLLARQANSILCMFATAKTLTPMNILLLGGGGRECALAWKLSQSPVLKKLFIAPGNAGTSDYGINIPVSETDFQTIKLVVLENDIDMVVVGPEAPLADGIADFFKSDGLLDHVNIIGPSRHGAMLESSKDFAKEFMMRHGIPTARYCTFTTQNIDEGYKFLESLPSPYVLKADGLAAGKGVIICSDLNEAKKSLYEMLAGKKFGKASERVVVEEFLHGVEVSVFAITDGKNYLLLPEAKDYKRIGDGDTGPNTGGMGAVSPVSFADGAFIKKVEQQIIQPTIAGLQKDNIDYCGFIFFGLMNCNGEPYVIEYNVRLGDPETEAILPRINTDLAALFEKTAKGNLADASISISSLNAVTVMLVSGGYPGNYEKGKEINGIDQMEGCMVFHAGTQTGPDEKIYSSGGRVLAITALGDSLGNARHKAYDYVNKISFEGVNYRKDIGTDLMQFTHS